ncbi:hypothetical protein CLIM01_11472 [Colletotrichum limetticola]|uniref:Nephrocystin 3-like N-terminal domain-containing protein n=1 Tax=Colletotrichum limetticola TaxID=1209924 RepID=A0ABQ9PHD2_9PEZI|nr:hypothetical protein CLIM01_11472 [Colletotrichum limetticola]
MLQGPASNSAVTVASCFCDYQYRNNTATAVISDLFVQLLYDHKKQFSKVTDRYEPIKDYIPNDLDHLLDLFSAFLKGLSGIVCLVIDGLDRCPDGAKELLFDFFMYIVPQFQKDGLIIKSFLTCRSGLQPRRLTQVQPLKLRIEGSHIKESIRRFIRARIEVLIEGCDQTELGRIQAIIEERAGGTYLWPAAVLKGAGKSLSSQEVEAKLAVFPQELHKIYDAMLREILPEQTAKAVFLFNLATVVSRQLTLGELNRAFAFSAPPRQPCSQLEDTLVWRGPTCLDETSGHLVEVSASSTVGFFEPSVRDYLLNQRLSTNYSSCNTQWASDQLLNWPTLHQGYNIIATGIFWILGTLGVRSGISRYHVREKVAHLRMFKLCWDCLCAIEDRKNVQIIWRDKGGHLLPDPGLDKFLESQIEYTYVVEHWLDHALAAGSELAACEEWIADNVGRNPNLRDMLLHHVVFAGDAGMAELLLQNGADVSCRWGLHGNMLHAASHDGHNEVVKVLLRHGADLHGRGNVFSNALAAAASNAQEAVVRTLLQSRGALGQNTDILGPVLQEAATAGNEGIVRALLDNGADVNFVGGLYACPLECAAANGSVAIIRLLLERGAEVNAIGQGHATALQRACCSGNQEIVQILLNHGADVNIRAGHHFTVLEAAKRHPGREGIVELLEQHGAEDCAETLEPEELYSAAARNDISMVQQLLSKGVNVNTPSGRYGNALQAASFYGHREVVVLLLDSGADVNALMGQFGSALQAASFTGHKEIVRQLLDYGANAAAGGGAYGNALHAASYRGHDEIIEILLDHGKVDVNASGEAFGYAMNAAAARGNLSAMRTLYDHGAAVNTHGGLYAYPLQYASLYGCPESVKWLIAQGASINARGGLFGYALQAACICLNMEEEDRRLAIVDLLIKSGARVNAVGGKYSSALHAAVSHGLEKVPELLFRHGARTDLRDARGRTAARLSEEKKCKGGIGVLRKG